jgi:exopolysaccharide production protein ExoZ
MDQSVPVPANSSPSLRLQRDARAGTLRSIQYLRALAAFMVAAYHTSHYLKHHRAMDPLMGWHELGLFGVSIFFAISGYLMATLVRRTEPWRFMAHRLVRIYPTYLIVIALLAAMSPILIDRPFTFDPIGLSLVPAGSRFYALGIEWTLLFEITFYVGLFAAALCRLTHRLEIVALAWLGLILGCLLVFPQWNMAIPLPIQRLPFHEASTGFAAGLLIPAMLKAGWVPRWAFPAGVALALVMFAMPIGESRFATGLISAVIVAGALRAEPRAAPAFDPLEKLGDWSYALYLCHVPIILLALALMPLSTGPILLWLGTMAACLVASALIGSLDIRLYGMAKRVVDTADPCWLRVSIAAYLALFVAIAVYGAVANAFAEDRAQREQAILERLPAEALRDEHATGAAVDAAKLRGRDSLRGEVTEVLRLDDGALVVRGWFFDAQDSRRSLSVAAFYNGVRLAVVRPSRKRPQLAAALGRPDLADTAIAFGIAHRIACVNGAQVVVVGLDLAGGAVVLPGKPTIEKCP